MSEVQNFEQNLFIFVRFEELIYMAFYGFKCKYCGEILPVEVREDNLGMVKVWCKKCGRCNFINRLKVIKE